MLDRFFQSNFFAKRFSLEKHPKFPMLVFLTLTSITNFLLCETIYFRILHSADQLYSPLVILDAFTGKGITHWYFPPSPYFFPDLVLMSVLYCFVPFLYLPTMYGVVQMGFVTLGIYWVLNEFLSKSQSLLFLFYFQTLIIIFSFLGVVLKDNPLPFVYFFTNAHHSTGFFFSFFLVSVLGFNLRKQNWGEHGNKRNLILRLFLYWIGFSLLYLSDRYSFCIGFLCFMTIYHFEIRKKNGNRLPKLPGWKLNFLILIFLLLNELSFYGIKQTLQIPNSFGILLKSISDKSVDRILFLSYTYLFDGSKHLFYQNGSLLLLISFCLFTVSKFPFRIRILLLTLIPVLLLLLIIVGRFTYLHPYPIRYLFPIWFFCFLGLSWFFQTVCNRFPISLIFASFALWILLLSSFPNPRQAVAESFLKVTKQEVSYDFEKPIRFWSEGKKEPIPIDNLGKPYRWITGAFHTP
ncbi:putative membrane protein [Leptospira yanagawae serovar Saopaulo str. Sao Paulo = ATCC 700523]|uniref:Putative membrane protein n=1 Tax=Leptospira yanagawae serovar Saopaulo str. Sao Paulo = ATCC 700523 TaxID=1249483 RepID=A0A5E8HDJ9_9LEPT|nr:hypothetical protein [Leptospira yanagawae]EOQ88096.1 putative membrane protein [Leptospira yanagawae serovar Saopaulo str. Sao Paulo = ATCC 700523]